MAYPAYVREKARCMRLEQKLTIDELANHLAIPRELKGRKWRSRYGVLQVRVPDAYLRSRL